MKIVRLKREELRQWRDNRRHLVDDEGHLTGRLEPSLETAVSSVTRSARSQRKSLTQRVAIGAPPNQVEHVIAVTIERLGMNADDIALVPTIDGRRIVTGREVVAARMLQEHGECQLRAPNGVILKVVRNPDVHRPTFLESQQIAPRPEHCPCKTWGRPHPGTHYSTCPWNKLAPPEERAPDGRVHEDEIHMLPTEAFASLKPRAPVTAATSPLAARVDPRAVVAQAEQIDSPETCRNGCLSWATPKGFPIPAGQHHPTCSSAKAWLIKTARETPRWLVDLTDGQKVRIATDQEIGEAEVTAQRTGSPIIHVDETPYAVVLQTELDAEDEASGESVVPSATTSAA
jgi:hypothetical protein